MKIVECKTFGTAELQGLSDEMIIKEMREAERFKAELENKGYSVSVIPVGLFRFRVTGRLHKTEGGINS